MFFFQNMTWFEIIVDEITLINIQRRQSMMFYIAIETFTIKQVRATVAYTAAWNIKNIEEKTNNERVKTDSRV